ncbi:MAG TPA: sulfite exporter TauE/SafE family protein [Salinimicrobium sp.]|nr:sulfite exporter TauE/SafE family protein [Salinimicrobium sp.]
MKVMSIIIYLIIIGLLAGFLGGLLGVGGGIVMVPLLILLLGFNQYEAQGTSLAVLAVPVTFLAAYNYYNDGYVNWKYAAVIAVTFVIGGYIGSEMAISIDQKVLKKIFGVIMLIVAAKMIFGK